ncbi:MAG: PKD domain-containing protein [Methylomarinum sp.]|nr:PKD domain-containing protein [Methylomarinum sp.]
MNTTQFKKTMLATAIAVSLLPVYTIASPNKVKQFGKNAPFLIDELPTGKVKSKLKSLAYNKQQKALKWLHSFAFTEHDLKHIQIDNEGGVLFGDSFDMPEPATTVTESTTLPQTISAADTFKLHSKPGATNVIYIDVNGHTFSNTAWSSSTIEARPFDTDGNTASFSSAELSQIAEIWHRIAEDYAPFNTDVTTEEPSNFGPTTGRILITHNQEVTGKNMPYSTAGGVAYVNVWGRSNYASYYSPALVYYNNLASYAPYISEAASHEMGHNLGLSHDGTSTQAYYGGHGSNFVSWGAIMGVGYYTNVTQWSKGEYTDASQQQDDIQLITNHLNSRADDHGNDIFSPTALLVDVQGNINVTSPETDPQNIAKDNKGIIGSSSDVDYFSFDAGTGPLDIIVTPAWDSFYNNARRGANLDIKVSLYNWEGQLITSNDPLDETDAQITTTVSSGQYLLAISGVGNSLSPYSDYGSLGQYFISGKVEPYSQVSDNTAPSPNPMGWAVAPYSQSRTSISMQASTATDESGGIQYNFICVSGSNCSDSDWQSSSQYTATGLLAGSNYSFQVMAKDAYNNTTQPSSTASANTAANNPPLTANSSISTQEDQDVIIDLASQSSDADGDALSFTIQSPTVNGTITNLNNGSVSYVPNNNFNGTDSFNYTVNDGFGGTANGSVSISVIAVNDAPVASAFAPANSEVLSIDFSSVGSFDPDSNNTLSYNWNFGDGNSSPQANPTHSYAVAGTYNVTLTVKDDHNITDSASITVTLTDPATLPPETPNNLSYTVNKTVTGRGKNKIVSGTIVLNWETSNSATHYNVWRCEETTTGKGKNRSTICSYSLFDTSDTISFTSLLTDSTVRFKISAENSNGSSSFSNEVIIKP